MARGRKPKPTAQKRAEGNLGKRKLPAEDEEVRGPAGSLDPPAWLDADAKREWKRLVKDLAERGLYTAYDRTAFAMYCMHFSLWKKAVAEAKRRPVGHPTWIDARKNAELLHRLLAEFGFTPSSRARLAIPKDPKQSPLAKFGLAGVNN